jgi:hypothetical protein
MLNVKAQGNKGKFTTELNDWLMNRAQTDMLVEKVLTGLEYSVTSHR